MNYAQPQAQNVPNLNRLKMYVDIIPTFDGDFITLTSFLLACDFLIESYGQTNDQLLKNYYLELFKLN